MIISLKYLIRLADNATFRPIERAKIYLEEARTFGTWKVGGYYVFTSMPTDIDYAEIAADGYQPIGKKLYAAERESIVFLQRLNQSEPVPMTVTVTENADTDSTELRVFGEWLGGAVLNGCHIRFGDNQTVIKELCGDNLLRLEKPFGVPLRAGQTLVIAAPAEEII